MPEGQGPCPPSVPPRGRAKLDGGIGNDNLRDTGGRNFLLGGAGNNTITGGPGRDYITTGSGRNKVSAGRGNDQINAAKAGPATRGSRGPGKDVERINQNEMRTMDSCERRFVVTPRSLMPRRGGHACETSALHDGRVEHAPARPA